MKVYKLLFILLFSAVTLQGQVNFFNHYRPSQTILCCPVGTYGLVLEMNYYLISTDEAELKIPVGLYWSVLENLEVGTQIAGVSRSKADTVSKGVSDILFGVKHIIVKEKKEQVSIPSVTAEVGFSLPTGNYKENFGTGGIGFTILWLVEKEFILKSGHCFDLQLNLGYNYNTKNPDDKRVGDTLMYTFGSKFKLTDMLEFSFGVKGENKKSDEQDGKEIKNTQRFESYLFCGVDYNINHYCKFFSGLFLGITDDAKNLIFNVGMMY